MKKEAVYKITNLKNGKVYVGYSVDVKRRFSQHKWRNFDRPLYNDMEKFGESNFKLEIIEEVDNERDGYQKEAYWIGKLDTLIPNGYNTLPGGVSIGEFSKIPVLQIDKKTLEVLGRFESMKEAGQKTGISQSSISYACDSKEGRHKSAGGYYWVKESEYSEKMSFKGYWEVLQIELETLKVVASYENVAEAQRELGISGLHEAVTGKYIVSHGYHWVYARNYTKNWKPRERKRGIRVEQVDKNTGEVIALFDSIVEAAHSIGTSPQNINSALRGKQNTAGGFKWRYA